jgi:hypothetical protein
MLSLRELQLRFFEAVTAERAPDTALLAAVQDTSALSASDRLGVYAGMYAARLLDVLREDYPRVLAVVGDEAFGDLARAYLARVPSRQPSVRHVGGAFAEFVAATPSTPPFLADLARLEWARVEVFDAPDAAPLRLDDLRAVAPDDWPALRFRVVPACVVLTCAWPVHAIWAAAGDEEDDAPIETTRAATTLRVWREDFAVSHAAMTPREARALAALAEGASFAEICESAAQDDDAERAARDVGALLLRWIEDGILAREPA